MVFSNANKQDIAAAINDQLRWDHSVDTAAITVDVREDGCAVLTGHVPTFLDKQSAGIDAMLSPGVTRVDNRLTVSDPMNPETAIIADVEIRSRIANALGMENDLDLSRLSYTSRRGVVTLEGSVVSYPQLLRVLDIVARVIGIVNITNAVAVVPAESFSDGLLARNIMETLEQKVPRDILNDIAIGVENGVVHIDGAVPDRNAWAAVYDAIAGVEGLKGVDNRLKVD